MLFKNEFFETVLRIKESLSFTLVWRGEKRYKRDRYYLNLI